LHGATVFHSGTTAHEPPGSLSLIELSPVTNSISYGNCWLPKAK
jgi:hypothetical protein